MIKIYGADDYQSKIINEVYQAVLDEFNLQDIFSVELSFVDENTIRTLNNQARGVDTTTDVLSFPYVEIVFPIDIIDYPNDIDRETGKIMLGEIMMCYPILVSQSELFGTTLEREIAYITAHGLLHLLGFDHIDELDKKEMRLKEETILLSIGYGKDE